jgi:lipopolysaccharide/colanic/teichoic acid biosynthesis glycosyltransferase
MIVSPTSVSPPAPALPTLWGFSPLELHERFWAAQGIQVVRRGQPERLAPEAQAFLLLEPSALAILDLQAMAEVCAAPTGELVYLRIDDGRQSRLRERVVTDQRGQFVRFVRSYDRPRWRLVRAALTQVRGVALRWQAAQSSPDVWRWFRRTIVRSRRTTVSCTGSLFDSSDYADLAVFVKSLAAAWHAPQQSFAAAQQRAEGLWIARNSTIDPHAHLVGPLWVGSGRSAGPDATFIGPAILWDDPAARPAREPIRWKKISPHSRPSQPRSFHNRAPLPRVKRIFDVIFSLFALVLTLPFYVPIALLILIDDGWPIFFIHRRETLGGNEFPCIKFRTMRHGAEQLRASLEQLNQCDGPQFYIHDDPRLTRVGRYLRRWRIDEFPQFLNVLVGHMSVVGPRPSPYGENQFCPAWREARLSLRPGITGLWQVNRSRARGADFQEWIKYDLQYVEDHDWFLDLAIILKTILCLLRGA